MDSIATVELPTTIDCWQLAADLCHKHGNVIHRVVFAYSESIAQIREYYTPEANCLTDFGSWIVADAIWEVHFTRAGTCELNQVIKNLRRRIMMPRAFAYVHANRKYLRKIFARFINRNMLDECFADMVYDLLADMLARFDPSIQPNFEPYLTRSIGWAVKKWRDPKEAKQQRTVYFSQLQHNGSEVELREASYIDSPSSDMEWVELFATIDEFLSPMNKLILRLRYIEGRRLEDLAKQFQKSNSFLIEWTRQALDEARFFLEV